MLPTLLALIANIALPATLAQIPLHEGNLPGPLTFTLRHVHVSTNTSRILFADVLDAPSLDAYTLSTLQHTTYKPTTQANGLGWNEDIVVGPNVTDRHTLRQLAMMAGNAYLHPEEDGWYDLDKTWNVRMPFGWEPDADGLRGHVFATSDNSTVAISIKGTSPEFLVGGGPTAEKDKRNNNILFSCCCAKVGFTWTPVCGCHAGGWKCDKNCLENSLVEDSLFYPVGTNLYTNVSYMYPTANIWIIGHSLGGAVASLLGVTFGVPVVAFESPGEKMAAQRLHLPSPPSTQHVTHVYHTADPVAMGTCNGIFSSCAIAGYAMESRCHLGKAAVYDTVTKWGWGVNVRNHAIQVLIDDVLAVNWEEDREVPVAEPEKDCIECYSWEYGDFFGGAMVS